MDLCRNLPSHLDERTEVVREPSGTGNADCVLYWMRTAVRTDENPALDVARHLAYELGLPLLVYHALSQRYEYASDRHHAFILQAARDVQSQFADSNIAYAFHLERPSCEGDYLTQLAERAAFVVTEDMPTGAPLRFLTSLVRTSKAAVLAVDTACVAPMRLVGKAYERAFEFRNKTRKLYDARVTRAWPECELPTREFDLSTLPFQPIDLQSASIPDLIAECEIDHTLGPVVDTQGGSAAGYARWEKFRNRGLKAYAKTRNNPLVAGVSRMSAYLHYGMVSPMRLAREAATMRHEGADKYLDELLIWRELAYCFCKFRPDHERYRCLPQWAQETLDAHERDTRDETYSWEQLARGETGDALWNAAQKSLLIHGELHNNVRMTWGKAILQWTASGRQALKTIVDLNHRYALDGRDPASYGGILWCLGQFDRPFQPEQPILGTVRPRPTDFHAQRLDVQKYAAKTSVTRCSPVPTVAIVGAGISGAIAARTLADHGLEVTVFEKSRGAGGRMATRRSEQRSSEQGSSEQRSFDHGAQYFTARDPRFVRHVDSWIEQGLVADWVGQVAVYDAPGLPSSAKPTRRYVGVPGMNAIARALTSDANLRTEIQVLSVVPSVGQSGSADRVALHATDGSSLGEFDYCIVTAPAPQTAHIAAHYPELSQQAARVEMNPCWSLMLSFAEPLPLSWAGAFVNFPATHGCELSWIARNSTKPGRTEDGESASESLVFHASAAWSKANLELSSAEVEVAMLAAFWEIVGLARRPTAHLQSHRWRYSIPTEALSVRALASADRRVIACGDWAGGPRVEGAFLSGCAAAGRVLGQIAPGTQASVEQLTLF